jgi:pyruvate-formate lyase-activating enzyme
VNGLRGLVADTIPFSWVDGPGNRFVVFLQGCNLDCLACHNPHTIPLRSRRAGRMSADDVVDRVRPLAPYLSGVTVSGGEPTLQPEFVESLFAAVAADRATAPLSRFLDSNGVAPAATWDRLLPVTDGVMLDLKALDPAVHRRLTGHDNAAVLASIRRVAAAGRLYEVRLLLVPGYNDDDDTLRTTADWLLGVDPTVRVKAIAFRRHGVRAPARHWPVAADEVRERYGDLLTASGLRDVLVV